MTRINIDQQVTVTLTKHGLAARLKRFHGGHIVTPLNGNDVNCSLWGLIHQFGEELIISGEVLFENNEIRVDE